eukprot:c27224_g1_i1 orf=2-217(-)
MTTPPFTRGDADTIIFLTYTSEISLMIAHALHHTPNLWRCQIHMHNRASIKRTLQINLHLSKPLLLSPLLDT